MSPASSPAGRRLIISIKPKYMSEILEGRKTVELRKASTQILAGSRMVLYSTSPTQAIVGEATVEFRDKLELEDLWRIHGDSARISHGEFMAYYEGCVEGVALGLSDVMMYEYPLALSALRKRDVDFRPPQSYMRVPAELSELLEGRAALGVFAA